MFRQPAPRLWLSKHAILAIPLYHIPTPCVAHISGGTSATAETMDNGEPHKEQEAPAVVRTVCRTNG